MTTADEPAMPCQSDLHGKQHKGLTKREHIASLIMQGLCTPAEGDDPMIKWPFQTIAGCAVKAADALIDQLNKNTQ